MQKLFDREWRLDNLYFIENQHGEKVRFERNTAQQALWDNLHYRDAILKGRQLGFSTFICILMLDACLFNSSTSCGVIDLTLPDATKKLDKIRFAYKSLPPELREAIPLTSDSATTLEWENGSRIDVGTSHRGGTLQILHVSEYGKISVKDPAKAKEIKKGAFATVHKGGLIFVESTGEGTSGEYFDMCKAARDMASQGRAPSDLEFKFFFFPWFLHPGYVLDAGSVPISKEVREYAERLKADGVVDLTEDQITWYQVQYTTFGPDDVKTEYPSTPDEPFERSVEGAYFATQMRKAREQGRIGRVPLDPSRPVHTCWDIGKDDNTAIWFFQSHGQLIHLIDYYENSGEGVEHYARYLKDLAVRRSFVYGKHYGPHDLDNSHWILPGAEAVVDVARRVGIDFIVVPRVPSKQGAIEAGRNWLPLCWIDEEHCAQGIRCLDNYRKAWDDKLGHFKSEALHDWSSHGADAFMTGACGHTPEHIPPPSDRYMRNSASRRSAWAA